MLAAPTTYLKNQVLDLWRMNKALHQGNSQSRSPLLDTWLAMLVGNGKYTIGS